VIIDISRSHDYDVFPKGYSSVNESDNAKAVVTVAMLSDGLQEPSLEPQEGLIASPNFDDTTNMVSPPRVVQFPRIPFINTS
jgi:hypothetical protein